MQVSPRRREADAEKVDEASNAALVYAEMATDYVAADIFEAPLKTWTDIPSFSMPPVSSKQREDEFRHAVLQLVGEVGYDCVTMDAVASRTRASKATLYRRWPSKTDLVIDALRQRTALWAEPPDTGNLRDDLIELLGVMARDLERDIDMALSVLAAARRDANLMELVRSNFFGPLTAVTSHLMKRGAARGELSGEVDPLFIGKIPAAMLLYRALWNDGPLGSAFIEEVVDKIVLPLVRSHAEPGPAARSASPLDDTGSPGPTPVKVEV